MYRNLNCNDYCERLMNSSMNKKSKTKINNNKYNELNVRLIVYKL